MIGDGTAKGKQPQKFDAAGMKKVRMQERQAADGKNPRAGPACRGTAPGCARDFAVQFAGAGMSFFARRSQKMTFAVDSARSNG